jgi:transcriptional regulator with XRE-family HTH domain
MGRDTVGVPRQTPRLPGPADLVVKRLVYERNQRDWTTTEVARRLTEAGFKISQSSVWSIENDPRRKITFAEAVAFADLYGLKLDELTEIPHDITGETISELLGETFAIRRDGNALVVRLAALLKEVNKFNQEPPKQIDALYEYLGISGFGLPLDELRSALAEAGEVAREVAEALPPKGIAVSFGPDGS